MLSWFYDQTLNLRCGFRFQETKIIVWGNWVFWLMRLCLAWLDLTWMWLIFYVSLHFVFERKSTQFTIIHFLIFNVPISSSSHQRINVIILCKSSSNWNCIYMPNYFCSSTAIEIANKNFLHFCVLFNIYYVINHVDAEIYSTKIAIDRVMVFVRAHGVSIYKTTW